jgi:hypothetical protein
MNDWFGPSVDDLRERFDRADAEARQRRDDLISRHESAGGVRPTVRPIVFGDDFVSGDDMKDKEVYDAYEEREKQRR